MSYIYFNSSASQEVTVNLRHFLSNKLTHDRRTNPVSFTAENDNIMNLSEPVLWVRQRRLMRLLIGSEQVNYRKLHWQTARLICRAEKDTALAEPEDRNNISRRGCLYEDASFALTDAPQMSPDAHLFVFMVTGGWHLSIFHEPTSACNKQINFPAVDYRAKTISENGTRFGRPQLTVKKLWESPSASIYGDGQNPPITATLHTPSDTWLADPSHATSGIWELSLKNIRMQYISNGDITTCILYKP